MELVLIRSNILHIKQEQSVETLLKLLLLIEDLHHDFLWFCNSGLIQAILWWNYRFSPLTNHLTCFPPLLSISADQPEVSVRSAAFFKPFAGEHHLTSHKHEYVLINMERCHRSTLLLLPNLLSGHNGVVETPQMSRPGPQAWHLPNIHISSVVVIIAWSLGPSLIVFDRLTR